jgi:hypothetical protein
VTIEILLQVAVQDIRRLADLEGLATRGVAGGAEHVLELARCGAICASRLKEEV